MIVVALVALAAMWFAATRGSADDAVRQWANDLRARLTPPRATVSDTLPPIRRDAYSATVTWELETRQTWGEFAKWTRERFAPDFKLSPPKDDSTVTAYRSLPGDAHTVTVTKLADGPPLRVRVTFHTMAD